MTIADNRGIFESIRDSLFTGSVGRNPYDMSEYSMQGPGKFIYPLLGGDPIDLVKREGTRRENVKGSNYWDRLSLKQQSGLLGMGYDRGSGLKALKANLPDVNQDIEAKKTEKDLEKYKAITGVDSELKKAILGSQEREGAKSRALQLNLAQLSSDDARDAVIQNNALQLKLAAQKDRTDLRNWENQVAFLREERAWKQDQAKEQLITKLLLGGLEGISSAFA